MDTCIYFKAQNQAEITLFVKDLQNKFLTGTPVSTLFYYYEQNWRSRYYGESKGVMGRPIYFEVLKTLQSRVRA
jgi:hypothetical protein